MNSIMGLVLAGGRSSRMGTDKAKLASGNSRLIDHVVVMTSAFCDGGVSIGGRDYGYPWFSDTEGIQGPMASIVKLKEFLNKSISAFFIIPVDMPFFGLKDFNVLCESLFQHPNHEAACFEQSHFPLLLKNSQQLALSIEQWIKKRPDDSVYSFLAYLKLIRIQENISIKNALVNLNYPQDYNQYADQLKSFQYSQANGGYK